MIFTIQTSEESCLSYIFYFQNIYEVSSCFTLPPHQTSSKNHPRNELPWHSTLCSLSLSSSSFALSLPPLATSSPRSSLAQLLAPAPLPLPANGAFSPIALALSPCTCNSCRATISSPSIAPTLAYPTSPSQTAPSSSLTAPHILSSMTFPRTPSPRFPFSLILGAPQLLYSPTVAFYRPAVLIQVIGRYASSLSSLYLGSSTHTLLRRGDGMPPTNCCQTVLSSLWAVEDSSILNFSRQTSSTRCLTSPSYKKPMIRMPRTTFIHFCIYSPTGHFSSLQIPVP